MDLLKPIFDKDILSQDEVHLPCKLKEDQDKQTQIHQTLNIINGLIDFK